MLKGPLGHIPGPFSSRFTNLVLKWKVLAGLRTQHIHRLHGQYGPIVRIAPNEISVHDLEAFRGIHDKGWKKGDWYQRLHPQQSSDDTCGLFCVQDWQVAKERRQRFRSASSTVRKNEQRIVQIITRAVERMSRDMASGDVDVMRSWSKMTAEVIMLLAFGEQLDVVKTDQGSP